MYRFVQRCEHCGAVRIVNRSSFDDKGAKRPVGILDIVFDGIWSMGFRRYLVNGYLKIPIRKGPKQNNELVWKQEVTVTVVKHLF